MNAANSQRPKLWLIIAGCCWLQLAGAAQIRVAIVGTDAGTEASKVLDLAIAGFKGSKDIEVLERAQIDRVLREQELSVGNRVPDAERVVKVGQLLRVDLFAVLEGGGPPQPFGVVVFDAQTGVRYADSTVGASNTLSAARGMAKIIEQAAGKSHRRSTDLRTVGVLSVRNADLPRQLDGFCDSIGLLVEREILGSTNIAVLERRRLSHMNEEHAAMAQPSTNPLNSSVVLIQIEIGRNPSGGLRALAEFSGAHGTKPARVSTSTTNQNPLLLAQELSLEILSALNATGEAMAWDNAREARRFANEADFFAAHKEWFAALAASEAAFALDPANGRYHTILAGRLWDCAIEIVDPGGQQWNRPATKACSPEELSFAIGMAHRSADLWIPVMAQRKAAFKPDDPPHKLWEVSEPMGIGYFLKKASTVKGGHTPETRESLNDLYARMRALRMDIIDAAYYERARDNESFTEFSHHLGAALLHNREFFSADRAAFTEEWAMGMKRWLALHAKYAVVPEPGRSMPRVLERATWWFPREGSLDERSVALKEEVWALCIAHPNRLVQIYGRLGRALTALDQRKITTAKMGEEVRQFVSGVEGIISDGSTPPSRTERRELYREAISSLRMGRDYVERTDLLALGEFMVARNDLDPEVFLDTVSNFGQSMTEDHARRALLVMERGLALLDAPTMPMDADERARTRIAALRLRDSIARNFPDASAPAARAAWSSSRLLIDLLEAKTGIQWLLCPVLEGREIFAAGFGRAEQKAPPYLQLVKISLATGEMKLFGKYQLEAYPFMDADFGGMNVDEAPLETKAQLSSRLGRAACLAGQNYVLATPRGLFLFPLDGSEPRRLREQDGLPSDRIHAVGSLHDRVFFSAGEIAATDARREGFFGSYDLRTKQIEVLASSRSLERPSFAAQNLFFIPYITSDAPRNQMLFLAGEGLWSFQPETRQYKVLFAVNFPGLQQTFWADKLDDDEFMTDCGHGAAKFNLRTGRAELLHATSPAYDFSPRFPSTTRVKQTVAFTTKNGVRTTNMTETPPSMPKPSRWTDGSLNVGPPYVFVGDWVWTGRPFQRITRDGTKVETFPSLRPNLKRPAQATVLRLISAREILAGDQYGFWLLELPPAEASSPNLTK